MQITRSFSCPCLSDPYRCRSEDPDLSAIIYADGGGRLVPLESSLEEPPSDEELWENGLTTLLHSRLLPLTYGEMERELIGEDSIFTAFCAAAKFAQQREDQAQRFHQQFIQKHSLNRCFQGIWIRHYVTEALSHQECAFRRGCKLADLSEQIFHDLGPKEKQMVVDWGNALYSALVTYEAAAQLLEEEGNGSWQTPEFYGKLIETFKAFSEGRAEPWAMRGTVQEVVSRAFCLFSVLLYVLSFRIMDAIEASVPEEPAPLETFSGLSLV